MKILLTGCNAHLAQALLSKLCHHPDISCVIGIDLHAPRFHHEKFSFLAMDVRDAAVAGLMPGCDALIHLAFVVLRGKMSIANMRSVNIIATQQVFDAAAVAGIHRLIHLSSAAVYGSGENLPESAPQHPLPNFLYALHKTELEAWLETHHPSAIRLRPHIILGRHAQTLLKRLIRQPAYIRLPDPQPLLQVVHEDDVVRAIVASLFANVSGPFNLAAVEPITFKQIIQQHHSLSLPVPLKLAQATLNASLKLFGIGGEPAWLAGIGKSLTLNCDRARTQLNWQPEFSTAATIRSVF